MRPRILFLVPADYEELLQKGAAFTLAEKEENGFFERVITVHPSAHRTQVLDLSPVQRLYEFREFFLPGGDRNKLFRYLHHFFHVFRLMRNIVRIVDQERINLVRANDPHFNGLLAWLLSLIRPIPFCISLHADYDKRHELDSQHTPTLFGSRRIARRLEKFLFRRANLVIPIRFSLAKKIEAYGVPLSLIRVIPHGIDLAPFRSKSTVSVRESLGISESNHLLSFAGRLSKENYVYDILHLAVELKKKRSDFVIVMAGDGPEKEGIKNFVAQHQLDTNIKLIGFQPRDYVISLRQESTISLCLMGGYSLIEACAAGRPVITYDVEWHSELIKNGETGCLIPEGNGDELIRSVESLLAHPALADRLGTRAKELAFERHDVAKTSAIKRKCYQELLELNQSPS